MQRKLVKMEEEDRQTRDKIEHLEQLHTKVMYQKKLQNERRGREFMEKYHVKLAMNYLDQSDQSHVTLFNQLDVLLQQIDEHEKFIEENEYSKLQKELDQLRLKKQYFS